VANNCPKVTDDPPKMAEALPKVVENRPLVAEKPLARAGENLLPKVADDLGTGGLIRTAPGNRPCYDNEDVEDGAECGDSEDDGCNGDVDPLEVSRQSATKQQESDLQH